MKMKTETRGWTRLLAIGLVSALALFGCAGIEEDAETDVETDVDEPDEDVEGDPDPDTSDDDPQVLRMAWSSQILTLDPPNEAGVHGLALIHNLYENLVGYDFENAEIIPELAREWEIADDGLTYTFRMDERAVFASGNPVTADDVEWTLQRIVDFEEAAQGFQVRPFLGEADIDVVDDQTLTITLASPAAGFLAALTGHASSILDSSLVLANEVNDDFGQEFLAENSAGSGVFTLEEYSRDNFYTLARNENYWREAGTDIDRVEMQFVQESSQQESLLRSGAVDVIFDALPDAIEELENDGFVAAGGADVFTYYVALNQSIEPLDDIRVRQAIRYAIDYDGIINELLGGRAVPAGGVLAEGLLGYDPSLAEQFTTDVDRALELLEEAGYEDGFSTELYVAEGTIRGLGLSNEIMATKLQSDLAQVGIDVELRIQDINTLFPSYREGELPLTFWFFGPTYPDSDVIMSPHGDWETQATTRVGFNNPEVTELIQAARVELDVAVREDLYREAAEIVNEESPYAFLFRPESTPMTSPELTQFGWVPIWAFDLSRTSFGG